MKITEIALTDIKSYEDRTAISLHDGVTAILGENGSGKSTIQEAIGFALFDSLPFNINDFVRENAASGTVEVTFEQETDAGPRRFRVTRGAGRAQYGVHRYSHETKEWIDLDVDSKNGLVSWLCGQFGLADEEELSELWTSCIGVPQTKFLSDFTQSSGKRQDTFDSLLGIEAYEESWQSALKAVPESIEDEQEHVRGDVRELTGAVSDLPNTHNKAETKENEIEDLTGQITETRTEQENVRQQYNELDEINDHIDQLVDRRDSLDSDIAATEEALGTAKEEFEIARTAARTCEAAREGYERHKTAADHREHLEDRKSELDELRATHREKESDIDNLEAERDRLQENVEKHEQARSDVEELAAQKERYDALDDRIRDLEQTQQGIEGLQEERTETLTEAREVTRKLRQKRTTIADIEADLASTPDVTTLQSTLDDQRAEQSSLAREKTRLEDRLARLQDADTDAPCPTCDRPLGADHRADVIDQRETRLDKIKEEQSHLSEQITELETKREEAQAVHQRANRLPVLRERAEELKNRLARLREKQNTIETTIDEDEAAVAPLDDLRNEHASLVDAHEAYLKAQTRAEDTADAEEQLAEVQQTLADKQEALDTIEDQIEDYDGVETELKGARETLTTTEDDYQTYIQNKQQAAQVTEREERVTELEDDLHEREAERDDIVDDLETKREAFDEDEYQELDERISELGTEITRLQTEKSTHEERLAELQTKLTELEEKLEQRQENVEQLKALAADRKFANWVRENVRAAGPKMRQVITDRISERGTQLFRAIRGRPSETLTWTNDYEIIVVDANVRKSFTTLSGGEKTAAALAVRLAILEQLSTLNVAFLDEPTANLDQLTKANLVEQLDRLDAFEQLTVISHDDTFESMTEYSVRVEKEQQTTEVVSD